MKSNTSPHILGTAPIGKLLAEYSIPAIIGMTVTSLYHAIDSVFIGKGLGEEGAYALSGVGVTLPLMNLVIAFCMLISIGGATISSIYMGQKDMERTTSVLHNVTILLVLVGIAVTVCTIPFLDKILMFFGASERTLPYAYDFMLIILLANPIAYLFVGLNNVMRSTGYPRKAMYTALLSVVVNLILAPIFIFKLNMGIKGAAWATVISQVSGMIWVLGHFINKKSFIHFKKGYFALKNKIIKSILAVGLAPFLLNVCASIMVVFLNSSLKENGGDLAIGAYGSIINRMLMLIVMIVAGLNQGMQPILGYNYGAKQFSRMWKTLFYGIFVGTIISTSGWVMFVFFPDQVVSIFSNDVTLNQIASNGLTITGLCFPLVGAQIVITNFFQAIGKSKISILLSLSRQMLFLVPGIIILPYFFGTDGVWISMPISDVAAFTFSMIAFAWIYKKIKRENRNIDCIVEE